MTRQGRLHQRANKALRKMANRHDIGGIFEEHRISVMSHSDLSARSKRVFQRIVKFHRSNRPFFWINLRMTLEEISASRDLQQAFGSGEVINFDAKRSKGRKKKSAGLRWFERIWASPPTETSCLFPASTSFSSAKCNNSWSSIPKPVRDAIDAFRCLELPPSTVFDLTGKSVKGTRGILLSRLGNTAGTPRQDAHSDSPEMAATRGNQLKQLFIAQYTAIISLQEGTRWCHFRDDVLHQVSIPPGCMLVFKADEPHAGAAYDVDNLRLLIQSYSAAFPLSDQVGLVEPKAKPKKQQRREGEGVVLDQAIL